MVTFRFPVDKDPQSSSHETLLTLLGYLHKILSFKLQKRETVTELCPKLQVLLIILRRLKVSSNHHLFQIDWLDRLTFIEIEKINQKEKLSSNQLFLMIEFPQVRITSAFYTLFRRCFQYAFIKLWFDFKDTILKCNETIEKYNISVKTNGAMGL